jgi:hypothetical protein
MTDVTILIARQDQVPFLVEIKVSERSPDMGEIKRSQIMITLW